MSRPAASGSQSSPPDEQLRRAHRAIHVSPPNLRPDMQPFRGDAPQDVPTGAPVSLPPLRQLSCTPPMPSVDRRQGNPLGVQSILNPQADPLDQPSRRRSASQMESPSPSEPHPPQSLPSISRPTSVESIPEDATASRPFHPPSRVPGRHLLSPRSPNLHRTQSLGVINPPTGTIDAHQSPFLSPNTRPDAIIPQPAGPTPPVTMRPTYFPTVPPTAPTPPPNVLRNDMRRPSVTFPQSGSASPIASFSPYSQPASVASSQFETSSQPGSYMNMPSNAQMQDYNNPPITMETDRSMIPMAPSGQSSIQIMTIKSQHGHQVQIPVEVQAASKVADEKRKRNAGASARFRARRKEKEREASISISRLEAQLREAAEDLEYYRTERDYFKAIVFQQPGAERHYARPPSPRHRRLSILSNAPSSTAGGGSGSSYSGYSESGDTRESERHVRRRTSSYHPAAGPPPTQLNGSGTQPGSFSATNFPAINPSPAAGLPANLPPPPPPPPPPQPFDPREQRPLPQVQQTPAQRPVLRDPFASDAARYDSGNWTPGSGTR